MIVDLIDKLIDRCIQLIQWDKQSRKNLFDDFVTPVFTEFETVYKDYLESFRRYRNLLKSSNVPLASVIDTIQEDNLFTEDQRARLSEKANDLKNKAFLLNEYILYTSD